MDPSENMTKLPPEYESNQRKFEQADKLRQDAQATIRGTEFTTEKSDPAAINRALQDI